VSGRHIHLEFFEFSANILSMTSAIWDRVLLGVGALLLLLRLVIRTALPLDMAPKIIVGNLVMSLLFLFFAFGFLVKKLYFKETLVVPRPFLWAGLFAVSCTASIFYSYDFPVTFQAAIHLVAILFFVLAVMGLLEDRQLHRPALYIFLLIAVISSVWALVQYKMLVFNQFEPTTERSADYLLHTRRPPSYFGWPNLLAGYLIMMLPLNWMLGFISRKISGKVIFFAIAVLNTVVLYLTLTVASWASLFVSVCLAVFFFRDDSLIRRHKKIIVTIVAACLLLAGAVLVKRFVVMHVESFSSRQAYIHNALLLVRDHPLIGNGWNSFDTITIPMIKNVQERSSHVHNSYLQVWAELGIFGLIAFLAFLFLLLRKPVQTFAAIDEKRRWVYASLWTGAVACAIDNIFSFTMIKCEIAAYWWFLAGVLLVLREPNGLRGIRIKAVRMCGISLTILVAAWFTFRLTMGEHAYFKGMHILNSGSPELAEDSFMDAYRFNPWDRKPFYGQALTYCALYNKTRDTTYLFLAKNAVAEAAKQRTLKKETSGLLEEIDPAMKALGLDREVGSSADQLVK
jgi:putative inorganic carbon (HCO3(-)) transporter